MSHGAGAIRYNLVTINIKVFATICCDLKLIDTSIEQPGGPTNATTQFNVVIPTIKYLIASMLMLHIDSVLSGFMFRSIGNRYWGGNYCT